jgi:ketosteroid isomerase-like protein
MRARFLFIPMLLSVAGLTSLTAQTTDRAAIRSEVETVNRAMEAAFNRKDLLAAAHFYADDAVIMGPRGERIRGRQRIDQYWSSISNPVSWKLDVLEVGGSKDEPWQLGRSTLVSGAAGQEHTSVTDFIVLWRRQADGSLKIYVDMYPGGGGTN